MKPRFASPLLAATVFIGISTGLHAVTYIKNNTTNNLTTAAGYTANSGAPTTVADFIQFDSNYINAAIGNTGSFTFGGFIIGNNVGGNIAVGQSTGVTWTVGSGAITGAQTLIDMSAANVDFFVGSSAKFFRLQGGSNSNMIFNVAANRTLTMQSNFSALGNNKTLRLDGAGNIIFNGAMASGVNPFGFNVNGANVTLNASNAFSLGTGAFTVSSGNLNVNNAGALGGVVNVLLNGGTILLNASPTAQPAVSVGNGVIDGLKFGTGITATTLAGLGLVGTGVGSSITLTNSDLNGVNLSVGNAVPTNYTYGGVITGAGSLSKIGSNTEILSVGGQTYAGVTNVSGGTLQLSAAGNTQTNLIGTGALNLSNAGTVRFNSTGGATFNSALDLGTGGGFLSFRGNSTFSPTATTGTGALNLFIDTTIVLTPSTFNGWNGAVNVSSGGTSTFRMASTFANTSLLNAKLDLGAGVSMTRNLGTNGATTTDIGTLSGAATSFLGGSLAGTGTFTFSIGSRNEDATFDGAVSDGGTKTALTKIGTGIQTLTGSNTFTGGLKMDGGILHVRAQSLGAGIINITGGRIELGWNDIPANSYTTANNITLNGGDLFVWDASQHLTGTLNVAAIAKLGSTFNAGGAELDKGMYVDGQLTGSANLTLERTFPAATNVYETSIVYFTNNTNTYSGTVTVTPNTGGGSYLGIGAQNAMANATVNVGATSGTNETFGSSNLLFMSSLSGGAATLGGLAGSDNVVLTKYDPVNHVYTANSVALTVGAMATPQDTVAS